MRSIACIAAMMSLAGQALADTKCQPLHDGLPLSAANASEPVYYGKAADQVFTAVGRTIQSISVWKNPTTGANVTRMGLYICEAETLDTGEVRGKAIRGLLLQGPVLEYQLAHDVPVLFRFVLDPPFTLPHEGQFAFAIRDEHRCFGIFALVSAAGNPYEGGNLWMTGPHISCTYGPYPGYPLSPVDLVFDIEYCDAVAAQASTWGEVKASYR